jgi:glycosyltransferase involved in cell wall biosynthesis
LVTARHARDCDLIHAEWSFSAAAAVLSKWLHRKPILATLQGSDIFQVTRSPLGSALTRQVLSRCDRITVLSRALLNATAALGLPAGQITIVPNGVDTNHFLPPDTQEREKLILYVGSFIERKGVRHLLDAIPQVLNEFPGFRLVLIGEGPQEPVLRQQAEDLGVSELTTFVGFRPQDEIKTWMQKAQVLVLPSLEEGMGVVLLEALACGTPLVASRIDGIQDVVTPDVGVLVPPADPQALAKGLRHVLAEPLKWDQLSLAARERAMVHYDWDYVSSKYVALYRDVISRSE